MTEYFQFLFVLVLLYLAELFQKTGPAAWVFEGARRLTPHFYPGNGSWAWVMANPLRPLSWIYAANPLPFLFTKQGICSDPKYDAGDVVLVPWAAAKKAKRDGKTLIAGQARFTLSSGYAAESALALLRLGSAEKALAEQFDPAAAKARLRQFQQSGRRLSTRVAILAILILVVWPLLIPLVGFAWSLLAVTVGAYAVGISTSVLYARIHREFFPASPGEVTAEVWKLRLYPFAVWRAADVLAQDLLSGWDPSVVSPLFQTRADMEAPLENFYRQSAHAPVDGLTDAQAKAVEEGYALRKRKMEQVLRELSITPGVSAPARMPGEFSRWCPVCLTQYHEKVAACSDCRGVPLQSFSGGT
jgi:uncharacterized membrane protein (DUF485 family)